MRKEWWNHNSSRIPFLIIIESGCYASHTLLFSDGLVEPIVRIKYRWGCITDENKLACFRTASDAKLCAKHNNWKYIGKYKETL